MTETTVTFRTLPPAAIGHQVRFDLDPYTIVGTLRGAFAETEAIDITRGPNHPAGPDVMRRTMPGRVHYMLQLDGGSYSVDPDAPILIED